MNKTQLVILWIGALVFLLCLWNPEIIPYTRYETEFEKLTDEEWEFELSKYGLSISDSEHQRYDADLLANLIKPADKIEMKEFLAKLEHETTKNKYIEMLENGERPYHMERVPTICFENPFGTGSDDLLLRLLSVTVLTTLLIYSYSDNNRAKAKEILQTIKRSFTASKPKSGDDKQKQSFVSD